MWKVEAGPPVPPNEQLVRPAFIIEYKKELNAVFDYWGLQFLFVVTSIPVPFPQCDAVQKLENELMVVGGDPIGYVFFTTTFPVAFKTDHNPIWNELVEKTCLHEGCK